MMKNITLCMIVRDEESNILRCLSSVYKYIDYYIICDTGSKDKTCELIENFFKENGIKGEIHHHSWVDFGHNRTEALKLCYGKTVWALMIDADDEIKGDLPIKQFKEEVDGYNVYLSSGQTKWIRTQIFNLKNKKWIYQEPLHEYPTCESPCYMQTLEGDYVWAARAEGYRFKSSKNQADKYAKDYFLLKSYLSKNPFDQRKQFYAAQSAFDAGLYNIAEQEYLQNINLKGWEEEIFISWYKIGRCREILNCPPENIIYAYLTAYEVAPHRIESICALSFYFRKIQRNRNAFLISFPLIETEIPKNGLFVEQDCYNWKIVDEAASTAFYVNRFKDGLKLCKLLLDGPFLPDEERNRVKSNYDLYKSQCII